MHAAKHDVAAVLAGGGHLAELIAVPPQIAMGDYFILLIMVPQDQQPAPHVAAHRLNPRGKLLVRERFIGLELERRGRGKREHLKSRTCVSGDRELYAR